MTPEYRHIPVMLEEVMDGLALQPGSIYLDCTLGGAGHSIEAAKRIAPDGILIGIDQDDMALEAADTRLGVEAPDVTALLLKGNFGNLDDLLLQAQVPYVDAILFDLGVSSPQLDIPERGFSYKYDAPLDMRMDPGTQSITAAQIIATYTETDLARILRDWGEEKWASRIAQFIVQARAKEPIETTFQLVDIIKAAIPASARRAGGHPAKQSFQALRIEVNQEMAVLERGLEAAIRWLAPGGRLVVMSYHSLEDRITKEAFQKMSRGCTCPPDLPVCVCGNKPILKVITRKPLLPSPEELERNPRSKSVKLRIAQKL
ncbi:MAG: 16S rRNA (cytosine(1402)-N(4))-methyltransferase RsmH [Coriobacteriales bacterium]|nr:16S rRNA (cytosine(1402)-N(4))-methyltransferase RsmH [Eggerthellaceae bacterium]MBQ6586852.1 16S rRNA (cytosine(1402)-N(4))-methyltransferase RsmH [Coriobacteriales bacterium]